MVKGTRVLTGEEAAKFSDSCYRISSILRGLGFEEIIVSSLSETALFEEKAGSEIVNQMYNFSDKKGRDICLIPEVTGVIQSIWRDSWSKEKSKPYKVFYIQRCYRYEQPQRGRYREFTQVGVEILGPVTEANKQLAIESLKTVLDSFQLSYTFNESVKRGLHYYTDFGFEAEVNSLGAQKQIAGGGSYEEGVGWAIGLDRLLLSLQ